MNSHKLYIKNMVCPRCIDTVATIFQEIEVETASINLGEVTTNQSISSETQSILRDKLSEKGFELLEDSKSKLISQIKTLIVDQIHHKAEGLKVNFSTLISENLHQDYSSLSRLFSSVEGITIEKYIMKQKVERVKELLFYDELTLSEIAFQMDYSSTAHLSSQFKKETGMTPSAFKKLKQPGHQPLDSL